MVEFLLAESFFVDFSLPPNSPKCSVGRSPPPEAYPVEYGGTGKRAKDYVPAYTQRPFYLTIIAFILLKLMNGY
jgi:hypothetical protein